MHQISQLGCAPPIKDIFLLPCYDVITYVQAAATHLSPRCTPILITRVQYSLPCNYCHLCHYTFQPLDQSPININLV